MSHAAWNLRDRRIVLLFALVAVMTITVIVIPPSSERLPALTVYSNQANGGLALRLWLDQIGYHTTVVESELFEIPPGVKTLLLLQPIQRIARDDVEEIATWVEQGGRLVLASDDWWGDPLYQRFGVMAKTGTEVFARIRGITTRPTDTLDLPAGATSLVEDEGLVYAGEIKVGRGAVIAVSAPLLFSNSALRDAETAKLVLILVGSTPDGSIGFDEIHHGYRNGGTRGMAGMFRLLLDESWGRAALYGALMSFVWLAMRGRRFGTSRPVRESRGRSLTEYVGSLAALHRASGQRQFIATHFERKFRGELARSLGLPSDVTEDHLQDRARLLGKDASTTLAALQVLRQNPGESQLVAVVNELSHTV
ncbi:MAG: DUF4350 domain-containing protein [Chloroflexota bacterium]